MEIEAKGLEKYVIGQVDCPVRNSLTQNSVWLFSSLRILIIYLNRGECMSDLA